MAASAFNYFLCHSAAFLLMVLADVYEVARCQHVFHKRVGDTVELSSGLAGQSVTSAHWNYEGKRVQAGSRQFAGRLHLNHHNFSLTLTAVTPNDTGVFSFVSAVNDSQRTTMHVKLHVHEPITTEPVVTIRTTWNAVNYSCSVLLDCIAPAGEVVAYKWTVRNRSRSGACQHLNMPPQHTAMEVTCTIFNAVSERSASDTVMCGNMSSRIANTEPPFSVFMLGAVVAAGACLLAIVGGVTVVACCRRRASRKREEVTIYADICDVKSRPTRERLPYEVVCDDDTGTLATRQHIYLRGHFQEGYLKRNYIL
ncbi:signaling lymphocytic activation molecule-like isoform X1 [Entelurus aequoreus]|uniref:signaling lymphocytic activation molecule-like isoform X1 n=1 Tax=Entelurus aequoreus TaxID=161455 RepID=UPI002B1D5CFB|nr:signaling lymphocytic activation molecule-like isoform X1 [Entelurus aequoreus]